MGHSKCCMNKDACARLSCRLAHSRCLHNEWNATAAASTTWEGGASRHEVLAALTVPPAGHTLQGSSHSICLKRSSVSGNEMCANVGHSAMTLTDALAVEAYYTAHVQTCRSWTPLWGSSAGRPAARRCRRHTGSPQGPPWRCLRHSVPTLPTRASFGTSCDADLDTLSEDARLAAI